MEKTSDFMPLIQSGASTLEEQRLLAEKKRKELMRKEKERRSKLENEIFGVAQSIQPVFEYSLFPKKIKAYNDYLLSTTEREMQIKSFQTNIKVPLTKMYVDAMFTAVYDNTTTIKCVGTKKEDHKKAANQENAIGWALKQGKGIEPMLEADKAAIISWEGYTKVVLNKESYTYEEIDTISKLPITKQSIKNIYPSIEYVDEFNIFFDPTAYDLYDSRFIIHRKVMSYEDIEKQYSQYTTKYIPSIKEFLLSLGKTGQTRYFFATNTSFAKVAAFFDGLKVARAEQEDSNCMTGNNALGNVKSKYTDDNFSFPSNVNDQNHYTKPIGGRGVGSCCGWAGPKTQEQMARWFKDCLFVDTFLNPEKRAENYRKKQLDPYYEVLEYWEDNKMAILINGRLFFDGENRYPLKTKPFQVVYYNKLPGHAVATGIGTDMKDLQAIADTMYNLFFDNLKMQIAPMFVTLKGSGIMDSNGTSNFEYEPFKVITTTNPDAFKRLDIGMKPDFSGLQVVQTIQTMSEQAFGINSYGLGYQNKVERSATGVSALVQAFKSRLLPMMHHKNRALANIARHFIAMMKYFINEDIYYRVNTSKGEEYKQVNIQDLVLEFDYEFDAQGLKTASREIELARYEKTIALAAQAGVNPNTGEFILNMEKLWEQYLDAMEMPSGDIILNTKEIAKSKGNVQLETAKIEQKMQAKLTPDPQTGSYMKSQFAQGQNLSNVLNAADQMNGIVPQSVEQVVPQQDFASSTQPGDVTTQGDILMDSFR